MIPNDVAHPKLPPSVASKTSSLSPETGFGTGSSLTSTTHSPHQSATALSSSLFAMSSTTSTSRPVSPGDSTHAKATVGDGALSGSSIIPAPIVLQAQRQHDARSLIARSFVPHIAVHASWDTDRIAEEKGFDDGLWGLLRPFGELVHGKVTIRDSIGASRSWEDFSVRFVDLADGSRDSRTADRNSADAKAREPNGLSADAAHARLAPARFPRTGGDIGQIEELLDRHLSYAESMSAGYSSDFGAHNESTIPTSISSPFYNLYLQRLLSGIPLSPHETFSHPVACIIAISSRNPSPIEALRQLYDSTSRGTKRLPQWVNGDYLRYYVLVHDEEIDDISKSTALFEQMKRHFGLHCHLLRLRSSQCVFTDDESVPVPKCEWIPAAEELADLREQEKSDGEADSTRYLYESDITAVRTFIREMVTQSIVPFMERCVVTWNDQVASRKRGLSGRFMSLSRRWTGFGSSSKNASNSGPGGILSGSNVSYDAIQGFYRPDTAEATLRKLADYAFMLRDWKLAQSTYDIVRADFADDKAWKYYAGANEMGVVSTLLNPQILTAKMRSESIDPMLDTASYSYISRCAAPYYALRCLALGAELLKGRGGSAADDAARWVTRIFELRLLGPCGHALFTQQVAACYAVRKGAGSKGWGSRTRKAAMWNILAANSWLELNKPTQARTCLSQASSVYSGIARDDGLSSFRGIHAFVTEMNREVDIPTAPSHPEQGREISETILQSFVDEEREELGRGSHRKSLSTPGFSQLSGLNHTTLNSLLAASEDGESGIEKLG